MQTVYIVDDGIQTGEYVFANDIFMIGFTMPSLSIAERMAREFAEDLAGTLSSQTHKAVEIETIYLTPEDRGMLPQNYSGEDIGKLLIRQNKIEHSLVNKVFSLPGGMTVLVKDSPVDSQQHRVAFSVIKHGQSEPVRLDEGWAKASLPHDVFMSEFSENRELTRQLLNQSIDDFLANQDHSGPR